jgi:rubrerythrin
VDITSITFADDEPGEELFPPQWSMGDAVDRRADDLAALAFGVRMEQEAIDLYGGQAADNPDPAAKRAYGFLVEEERRHYDQLKDQWERLSGSPFSEV